MSGQNDKVKSGDSSPLAAHLDGRLAVAERCRYCGRRVSAADPEQKPFLPFCSERCKMADLGGWLEGRYVISRKLDEVADDAAGKPGGRRKKPNSP